MAPRLQALWGDVCLAVAMQVVEVDGFIARCEACGVSRDVNLFLLQHEAIGAGDHVLVHVGYAIARVDEERARDTWALYESVDVDAEGGPAGAGPSTGFRASSKGRSDA